jgi:YaiO family outer membrane protein
VIRRFTWLMVSSVLLSLPAAAQDEEQSARSLIANQHFAEARALYVRLLERDAQNLDYQIWIARLSAWMKDYAASIETYDRVLEREPRNAEALVGKAYVRLWQHRFSEAGELLAQAKKSAPEDPEVEIALARMCHYQSQERAAADHVSRALSLDPGNSEAKNLRGEIDPPRPVELRLGYGQDRFSFTNPGNMGALSAGYIGETNRFSLQYEEWSRFDQRARRAGFNFTKKWSGGWWLRAGAMLGPGAVVIPRQEYTAGISRSLPRRFVLDADYRLLRFRAANVHLLSPALSYYFAKPAWVTATLYNSWTAWRTGTVAGRTNYSWLAQVYRQVARPVVLHAGYARGNESFEAISIDSLSVFQAKTYIAGADIRLSRAYSAELFCAYQTRSNRTHQTSFGVNFTVRQ